MADEKKEKKNEEEEEGAKKRNVTSFYLDVTCGLDSSKAETRWSVDDDAKQKRQIRSN